MLILSRKKEESFIINDNIIVKVIDIGGERIKIGITAPRSIKIIRSELQQTIEINQDSSKAVDVQSSFADFVKKTKSEENDN
ncbi:MAG: carbon storage regulator [Oscillospiraceae bacterium]|nr:carbon storage regulator [Oscillospiraceae bacterium]